MQSVTRWNIRAGDAVQVIVRFESPEVETLRSTSRLNASAARRSRR